MERQRAFWHWFEANESRYRDVEVPEKEELLDALLEELHDYCPGLWFETGTADDGVHELIVSAEGDTDYFSAVRTLVATAPAIANWRFIAFKPAMGFAFTTQYKGIVFDPDSTWFLPLRASADPASFGLRVAYGHFDERRRQDFLSGTYIMLECVLGELALAEQVRHVEVAFLPSSPGMSGYRPLTSLLDYLDERAGLDIGTEAGES